LYTGLDSSNSEHVAAPSVPGSGHPALISYLELFKLVNDVLCVTRVSVVK